MTTKNGPTTVTAPHAEELSAKTVRMLAMDMVRQAGSGHYGFPLGATNIIHTLFARHLRFNPQRPDWLNRDRFVLSAGHGSAMLYAMLHVAGYDISVDDLKAFRTMGSKTPGHPERGETPGVEVTTGPLGQGVANAVGLAIAEEYLRAELGKDVVDHRTWVLASDGDLMEGVSHEAAALAGKLQLSHLALVYDDNDVVIDGRASEVFDAEGMCRVFEGLGWTVVGPVDASDVTALDEAFTRVTDSTGPTFIRVRSKIGAGSPLEDDRASHASVPSPEELKHTRQTLGLLDVDPFAVPEDVHEFWRRRAVVASASENADADAQVLEAAHSAFTALELALNEIPLPSDSESTRQTSGRFMNALAQCRFILGGSADLADATFTELPGVGVFSARDRRGRNIRFGVREHAMGAITSGISMHSVLRAFSSTFLMFATYEANAIRMAALQRSPAIFVFSHDSVLVGEDGPTHQPVEVLPFLRAIPQLQVWRPADGAETRNAWLGAIGNGGPSALVLSRQAVPQISTSVAEPYCDGALRMLRDPADPDVVILGTGSEVHLALEAADELDDLAVAVASVPRLDTPATKAFSADQLTSALKPDGPPRLMVEAAHPMSWWPFLRAGDGVIGVTDFGASAPAKDIARKLGLTSKDVVEEARRLLT